MDAQKIMPWVILGGLAIGAYLLVQSGGGSSGSGYATIQPSAPDTSASDQARYGFLSTAIGSLVQLEEAMSADQYQFAAIQETVKGQVAAAQAQAEADKAAARAAASGTRGLDLGPVHFHW